MDFVLLGATSLVGGLLWIYAFSAIRSLRKLRHAADSSRRQLADTTNLAADVRVRVIAVADGVGALRAQLIEGESREHGLLVDLATKLARLTEADQSGAAHPTPAAGQPIQPAAAEVRELSAKAILAELTHVLGTPLSALRLSIDSLRANVAGRGIDDRLRLMEATVQSCVSSLATFRGLVDLVGKVGGVEPDLPSSITTLFVTADEVNRRGARLDLTGIPNTVPGFTVRYLQTLLQPLVENAVENSPDGGTVEVRVTEARELVTITITNQTSRPVDPDLLTSQGRTTKAGGGGMGLRIAQRLAAVQRGTLVFETTGVHVRAVIQLPRRAS